jgi:hypothetical protein
MNCKLLIGYLSVLTATLLNPVYSQILSVAPGSAFNIVSGTVIAADGLELIPASDFILNAGISKSTSITNATTFPYIPRVYLFSQTTNSFSGTFKINYSDADLNGINIAENNLKVIHHNNAWTFDAASSTDANTNLTTSSSYNAITLDEITLATCLPVSSSFAMKLSNQATHVKFLSNSLSSWSVLSGVDAADFSINPSVNSDELLFNTLAVNANPHDANLDNNYLVTVSNGCEIQNLSIDISPFCGNWADIVTP